MPLDHFINRYTQPVIELLHLARAYLLNTCPELIEELDESSRIIVYRIAPGNDGIVFTLIPSRAGVKLGFYSGRALPDPKGLLQDNGKVHATISLTIPLFENAHLEELVLSAMQSARDRNTRN